MPFYPVFLDLRGRPTAVIGTGPEAERRVEGLLAAGAQVTVITQSPSPPLRDMAAQGRIALWERPYQEGDLAGMFLAISATTEDLELSGRIAGEARRAAVLLNVVDVPALCDWIAPAVILRGDVVVAISTGGLSPAMARYLRERIEEVLPAEYAVLAEIMAEVRRELRRRRVRPQPEEWQEALDAETMRLLGQKDWDAVQERLLARLGNGRVAHLDADVRVLL